MSAPRVAIRETALFLNGAREELEYLLVTFDLPMEQRNYVLRSRERMKKAAEALGVYFESQGWPEDKKLLEGKSPYE